jgi:DNA adenine methylase
VTALRAPFPWPGGKSRAAALVWAAFGDVPGYVEPFYGSGAVLLGRPTAPGLETINDADALVVNFWRAVVAAPDVVALHASDALREADLHARHAYIVAHRDELRERILSDPEAFDARTAGWWCWGLCAWIGSGWCTRPTPSRQFPNMSGSSGVLNRALDADGIRAWMRALHVRLGRVRVACGDWSRVLSPSLLGSGTGPGNPQVPTPTGVFLDPPYKRGSGDFYEEWSRDVATDVATWARANGDNPRLRIALCGEVGDHDMPGWRQVGWQALTGFSSIGGGGNSRAECVWLSPHCLSPEPAQRALFG